MSDETLIHLDDAEPLPEPDREPSAGLDPGLDMTGEIARIALPDERDDADHSDEVST